MITGVSLFLFSCGIMLVTPSTPHGAQYLLFLLAITMLSISEAFFSPVVKSLVVKYSNPKYLATILGLIVTPSYFLIKIAYGFDLAETPGKSEFIALTIGAIILAPVIIFQKLNSKTLGEGS
ncbi:hypothetical protein [Salibacter halophilus]|uniref:MFS transporter n=1 Tax=Salibacter halophilus TaxID=1803916 RepID=A0A6N6M8V0_9FLAO|nr:hypothetical protein [Salibacter halophilus]KAB1064438.1 hypothetical protein F3059_06990 [Salibacter halophilus]